MSMPDNPENRTISRAINTHTETKGIMANSYRSNFADEDRTLNAFEAYVLSKNNLEEGFQHLIKGSVTYNDLFYLDLLKKKGENLTEDEKAKFKNYIRNHPSESGLINFAYGVTS